jgi:hypothetical protein
MALTYENKIIVWGQNSYGFIFILINYNNYNFYFRFSWD